jgi:hypothetical protein
LVLRQERVQVALRKSKQARRLRRIVLVMPFLNIIDQTTRMYLLMLPMNTTPLCGHVNADRLPNRGFADNMPPGGRYRWAF